MNIASLFGRGLSDTLIYSMQDSRFDKTPNRFLPEGDLNRIISKATVLNAMEITQPTQEENDLVNFTLTKAKRTFATAAYIGLESNALRKAMLLFLKNGFEDRQLPIEKITGQQFLDNAAKGIHHPFVAMEEPLQAGVSRVWTFRKIWSFQDEQGRFLAPVLSTDEPSYDFWDLTLPFIVKHATRTEGSFGTITKYEIHHDHIKDPTTGKSPPLVLAIKQIKVEDASDRKKVARHWRSEVKAMAMMNTLDHKDHIVRFITAFRHGKPEDPEHYVVTEWADGGNLRDLWNSIPNPPLTVSLVQAVIEQLLGLSEAFFAAHFLKSGGVYTGASYRHGDLKPANILWFRGGELGRLKICDWGEAKNKQVVTAMRHSRTSAEYGTRRYEPPEVETGVGAMLPGQEERRRSRLYDIWAMGCITLEFIVWLFYGVEGLLKFNKSVKGDLNDEVPFYQFDEIGGIKRARVHKVALYWIDYMAQDQACRAGTTALGDLLEVVLRGLLVVKLPRKGGTFAEHNLSQPQMQTRPKQQERVDDGVTGGHETTPETSRVPETSPTDIPAINITLAGEDKANELKSEPTFVVKGPERFRADQLRNSLILIKTADEDHNYWSTQRQRPIPDVPDDLYSRTSTFDISRGSQQNQLDYGQPRLDPTKWKSDVDNVFATKVFSTFNDGVAEFPMPAATVTSNLCEKCQGFRDHLWNAIFSVTYDMKSLEQRARAKECDLCDLLWRTCQRNWGVMFPEVTFEKTESSLTMNSGAVPVLSICRSPDCKSRKAIDIQIGFAELPDVESATHFEIMRQWLKDCDENHQSTTCRPTEHISTSLPTRLIDVGSVGEAKIRLWETAPNDTGDWVALSHQWGPPEHFSTTTDNRADHLAGIDLDSLPATFKDAVTVTRALGNRYLWIDSICIIQAGKDADFEHEARRMEEVYSGARCVIAASRASGHKAGFLKPRIKRDYVALRRENDSDAPFYISQTIDNFKEHVLEGPLNRRGWVFQEHALARRTIFFDEHQTYWECGHGIRCETMTTLHNESAKLLGDPNFPKILGSALQGEKIARFQELYQDYSRLGLTKQYDRPTAIAGLQQRLLRTLNVRGGFGIFDGNETKGLLRRSLLWCRGNKTLSLQRIEFPIDQIAVPSWSWMAHTGGKSAEGTQDAGGIDYFKPSFGRFDWEDLQSPWSQLSVESEDNIFVAKAVGYDRSVASKDEVSLVFDAPAESDRDKALCVVLGVQKGDMHKDDKRHYVLLIVATEPPSLNKVRAYERVGAGYLSGRCLRGDPITVKIR